MWEVSPVTLLKWVPWRAWECGWLAAGVDFAQNDWPLISQLVSQCHTGQSALGGLCSLLGLAHSRHSANICSMNYSVPQNPMTPKKEAPGRQRVTSKSGLGEETQESCAFSLYWGPCSDFTLSVYAAGRDGRLEFGRSGSIGR